MNMRRVNSACDRLNRTRPRLAGIMRVVLAGSDRSAESSSESCPCAVSAMTMGGHVTKCGHRADQNLVKNPARSSAHAAPSEMPLTTSVA